MSIPVQMHNFSMHFAQKYTLIARIYVQAQISSKGCGLIAQKNKLLSTLMVLSL